MLGCVNIPIAIVQTYKDGGLPNAKILYLRSHWLFGHAIFEYLCPSLQMSKTNRDRISRDTVPLSTCSKKRLSEACSTSLPSCCRGLPFQNSFSAPFQSSFSTPFPKYCRVDASTPCRHSSRVAALSPAKCWQSPLPNSFSTPLQSAFWAPLPNCTF